MPRGMLSVVQVVASGMMGCSSTETCGTPGMRVTAPSEQIVDVLASDEACAAVTPTCVGEGDASCAEYAIAPIAAGNCHVDVDLAKGTRFSTDVTVGPIAGCSGFYPTLAAQARIEVP